MRASDRAYEALKDEILRWRLRPGTVLGEAEHSARLGISRTPFREAVARLAGEGLVETARGHAGVVTDISPRSLGQLFELREALETQAARIAARRRPRAVFEQLLVEFDAAAELLGAELLGAELLAAERPAHEGYYALVARLDAAIDDAIANPYLRSALAGMRNHLARARRLAHDNPARLAESAVEHRLIIRAIVNTDEMLAAQATAVHLHKSLDHLLRAVQQGGTPIPEPVLAATGYVRAKGTP